MSGHVMLFPQCRSEEDWEKILPFGREALVTQNICFCWQTASHVSALLDGVGWGLGGWGGMVAGRGARRELMGKRRNTISSVLSQNLAVDLFSYVH